MAGGAKALSHAPGPVPMGSMMRSIATCTSVEPEAAAAVSEKSERGTSSVRQEEASCSHACWLRENGKMLTSGTARLRRAAEAVASFQAAEAALRGPED